ncbi:MAG: hypothetical protein KAT15_17495, partial [Bacteroidales bacterium]|nr:hypothetical protein [Bacteroidales bacterium]
MKTSINISIILSLALVLGACSSTYKAGVSEYDDLYYTPRDARMQSQASDANVLADAQGTQQSVQDELSDYEKYRLSLEGEYLNEEAVPEISEYAQDDTAYYGPEGDYGYAYYDEGSQPPVINHYYGTVNQYPSYASRIQRFHSPYVGYNYYDPWYDPYYNDPWYGGWGSNFSVSIGFGMGWGYPSYGWGYPSYGWGYPSYGWGYPRYGYGGYYSSYGRGYNHGWYDG